MEGYEIGNLIYLVLLLCAVGGWVFVQQRQSLGRVLQQAIAWVLIFAGVVALFGLWEDLRGTLSPQATIVSEGTEISVPKSRDGHFYLTLEVNGEAVDFLVDTGATSVVLTQSDAAKAGIEPETLIYSGQANTANGIVRTAPVWLDTIGVGSIIEQGVRAWVNEGELDQSLLGMTYLQRFESVQITQDRLILSR